MADLPSPLYIDSESELAAFCRRIEGSRLIAFDTEFISEDSYRPQLCLLQVALDDEVALIDGVALGDLAPFWRAIVESPGEPVVHAGRAELLFCQRAIGRMPERAIDVQVAAGLMGLEYPAAYAHLVQRLIGHSLPKSETRSDWRRRPLNPRQIEYAVQDVVHLRQLHGAIVDRLHQLGRLDWLRQEMLDAQRQLLADEVEAPWERLSGIHSLGPRCENIAIALWKWRDRMAAQSNQPARRILRDDLLIELARRESAAPAQIKMLRGMERRGFQKHLADLAEAIAEAQRAPVPPSEPRRRSATPNNFTLLGQFLYSALSVICHDRQIHPALVGTIQDVRRLAAWELDPRQREGEPPRLIRGWRAGIVGDTIRQMLHGQFTLAVADPHAEQPLRLESRPEPGDHA